MFPVFVPFESPAFAQYTDDEFTAMAKGVSWFFARVLSRPPLTGTRMTEPSWLYVCVVPDVLVDPQFVQ
jgi:hypothetical protein